MADTTRRDDPFEPDTPEADDGFSAPTVREHGPYPAARTIREQARPQPAAAPTVREQSPPAAAPTLREAPSSVPGAADGGYSPIPDELSRSYRLVRQLAAGGAEAALFEVAEVATGAIRILKLYHQNVSLRGEALLRIQSIDTAHVVHLVDHGRLEDGRWFEVQERIEAGTLVDYRSSTSLTERDLHEVVAELGAAVAAFHRAGLAHHDIKPENILVRNVAPLDLVLGDFGLSVVSDSSTYYATNRNATIAYQAPETMQQVGGGTRDYWAVGLTVAMLATGETPYTGLNAHAILDQHSKRIPPAVVESMPEGRLKQLCRGLTRYDRKARWSEREVRDWLRGDSPTVMPDEAPPQETTRVVHFNNKPFTVPSALAREMLECWSLAAETIGVRARREQFLDELILAFGTEDLARLVRQWSSEPPRRDRIDAHIVELLLTLDPDVPAVYRSRHLDADTVAAAALGDSEEDARLVADLLDRGLLTAWSRGAGHAALGDIDRSWRSELERASGIVSSASAGGAVAPPMEVWTGPLLAVCARPDLLEGWERQRSESRPAGEHVPRWYEQISHGTNPAEVIGGALLASEAQRVQRNEQEAQRRRRENARRARRDRKYLTLRSLFGRAAAVAFVGSWVLEFIQVAATDYERAPGTALLPGAGLLLWAIAFALFRQWRNAAADLEQIQERGGVFAVAARLRGDELSASRRAEAYGVLVFVLVAGWAWTSSLWPPLVRLVLEGSPNAVTILQDGYKLAGVFSLGWSAVSYLHRRNEGPPTADQVHQLQAADRRTLKRTGVFAAVWAALQFASLSFSTSLSAVAELLQTSWAPIFCGGMCLLVRGRWSHRRTGTRLAVVLLVGSMAVLGTGLLLGWRAG